MPKCTSDESLLQGIAIKGCPEKLWRVTEGFFAISKYGIQLVQGMEIPDTVSNIMIFSHGKSTNS